MDRDRPDFPTMEQVEKASHEQLAYWYRFLPSGDTPEQKKIMDRMAERFKKLGGMTPELSKRRRPTSDSVLSLYLPSPHAALYDRGEFIGCACSVPSPMTLAFAESP